MNKLILSFILVFLQSIINGQELITSIQTKPESFEIKIDNIAFNYKDLAIGKFIIRDYIDYTYEMSNTSFILPSKDLIIAIPANSTPKFGIDYEKQVSFENTVPMSRYEEFQADDHTSKLTKVENNQSIEIRILGYFWYKNVYCAHVKIPLVNYIPELNSLIEYKKINLKVDLLERFDKIKSKKPAPLKTEYGVIANWEMVNLFKVDQVPLENDPSGDWINNNSNYIKLGVFEDGLYRLHIEDLKNEDLLENIPISTIKIFESGKQVPTLKIDSNNNFIFDGEDYIEFYATKNYSEQNYFKEFDEEDEYIPYLDRYTDTSYYFFTWGMEDGLNVNLEEELNLNELDTLDYYTDFTHYEANTYLNRVSVNKAINQDPLWLNTDIWQWRGIGVGEANFNFSIDNIVDDKPASIYAKIIGAASDRATNSHNITLKVNNASIDSTSINRNKNLILGKSFNSTNLFSGINKLKIVNHANGSIINSLSFDWFEVRYPRKLIAIGDSLTFQYSESGTKPDFYTVAISNFATNNPIIYQIFPNVSKISNFNKNNFTVYFNDTIAVSNKYIIIDENKILTPIIYGKTQFKDLRNPKSNISHLIITHSKLISAANDYSQYIKGEYEIETSVVDVKDIFNEFSFGYPNPIAIKKYLKFLHTYWPNPNLNFLFIVGTTSYDSKNYLQKDVNANLVPSFGEPVSDVWYSIWDTTGALLPQLAIGRLSAKNETEIYDYLEKHKNNNNQVFDEFNKRALFFSGGDGNTPSELEILRNVNQYIIDNYALSKPLSLQTSHFYKTTNPQSDFGPFNYDFINNEIKQGGLFISYIGHSGTRTWDNSISEPQQLDNLNGKSSLISDFGCSTNKFAEPDIECFSTLFIRDGIGIGYIGNSSLGYLSTATNVSKYFYESILVDSIYTIGNALNSSKEKLLTRLGSTGVYRIFVYTNQLAGDPIVSLPFPQKVNLVNDIASLRILNENINDLDDSVSIVIPIINYGIVFTDSFNISINENWNGKNTKVLFRRSIPNYKDEFNFSIPVKGRAGKHSFLISFDSNNEINEIFEDDNDSEFSFNVSSTQIRSLLVNQNEIITNKIVLLNPTELNTNNENLLELEIDTTSLFKNSMNLRFKFDTLKTDFNLSDLLNSKRYWIRSRLLNDDNWNSTQTFIKDIIPRKYHLSDSLSLTNVTKTKIEQVFNKLILSKDSVTIEVQSSGGDVAKYGAIFKDGINVLPNTFAWGMGIAVFDTSDMSLDTAMSVYYGDHPDRAANLASYIISIPNGKLVAMNVIDDGSSNLSEELKSAIKTLGSTKVDSISFRGPWALMTVKGGKAENVIEVVKKRVHPNIVIIGEKYNVTNNFGELKTAIIGPSTNWENISIQDSLPNNSSIKYFPILIGENSIPIDTLDALSFLNGSASLNHIDAKQFPYIKILAEFEAGDNNTSPELYSLGVDYVGVPELATNYQVVSIEKDTLQQGEDANLSFYVYNVGESAADNFKVIVEVIKPDNSKEKIFEDIVDSLGSEKRKKFNIAHNTTGLNGSRTFSISIDSENKIMELYEDNNFYNIPFYVIGDTTKPSMNLTIDGNDIFDGEYIASNPKIKIELSDPSLIPITDTSSISIFLNNKYLSYKGNEEVLSITYSASNPKAVVNYLPTLEDGEYNLRVFGKDASGNIGDSSGIAKNFNVESNAKLLNVYNYPNPFNDDTYFTFKLTQIPDEIKIKVFTIAGRLIKEFVLNNSQLNFDLNKIHWDGRDDDGDKVGNGVYLYKVIMDVEGKKTDVTQKLAIVR